MDMQKQLDDLAEARWLVVEIRAQLVETKEKLCHLEASYRKQLDRVKELEKRFDVEDDYDLAAIVAEE